MKKVEEFNWEEIRKDYESGLSQRDLTKKYKVSVTQLYNGQKLGLIKFRDKETALKLSKIRKPQKHSKETKEKISKIRRKFLAENPDKVPYKLNHYSKGPSYPERYFLEVFQNEEMNLISQFQIGTYQLDFADVGRKIDIEIDGDQHYLDPRVVESDKRRNQFLEEKGWKVFRVKWSSYQKLSKPEKEEVVKEIKKLLN